MNSATVVSIISLLGCLVLVVSGWQRRGVGGKNTALMAIAWVAIFASVAIIAQNWAN